MSSVLWWNTGCSYFCSMHSAFSKINLVTNARTSLTENRIGLQSRTFAYGAQVLKSHNTYQSSYLHRNLRTSECQMSDIRAYNVHCEWDSWEWNLSPFPRHCYLAREGLSNTITEIEWYGSTFASHPRAMYFYLLLAYFRELSKAIFVKKCLSVLTRQ